VKLGDTVTVRYVVARIDDAKRRSVATVEVVNQHGETVAAAEHIMKWTKALSSKGGG